MQHPSFVYESLKHPAEIGTITQSSEYLSEKIAREVQGKRIVEFGAGTGRITFKLLKYLSKDSKLTCFEINKDFCDYLKNINDSRVDVINDRAENLEKYINLDKLDCIVSSLPLALMGKLRREKILEISSKAEKYIQMQYSPFLFKKLKNYFTDVELKFELRNLPPAFIYICSNGEENRQNIGSKL